MTVDSAPELPVVIETRPTLGLKETFVFGALLWIPMFIWFAAMSPGVMSADSIAVWEQVWFGAWIDSHPPLYTLGMWLSMALSGGPALLALGQSVFLALSLAFLARAMIRLGGSIPVVVGTFALVALAPPVGVFSVSLWKDVPYTASLLFAGAAFLSVLPDRSDKSAASRGFWVVILWLAAASLFRQNGIALAMVMLALVFLFLRPLRRLALIGAGLLVVVVFGLKALVYPVLGVEETPDFVLLATFANDIAAVAEEEPDTFQPDQLGLISEVAPLEEWRQGFLAFGCHSVNWVHLPGYEWGAASGRVSDYIGLWVEVAAEHPDDVLENRFCMGRIAWLPDIDGDTYIYTASRGIDPNPYDLYTRPLSRPLHEAANAVLDWTESGWWKSLFWRGVLWSYIAYSAFAAAALRKRSPAYLIPILPLLAQQLSVLPLNPAQDARYMFFSLMYAIASMSLAASWFFDLGRVGRHAATARDQLTQESFRSVSEDAPL